MEQNHKPAKEQLDDNRNLLKCPPKSLMEEAISYTYKILKKLSLYVTDGRYKIDDNMVENSIRPLAIGRKNYLFCGDGTSGMDQFMWVHNAWRA